MKHGEKIFFEINHAYGLKGEVGQENNSGEISDKSILGKRPLEAPNVFVNE